MPSDTFFHLPAEKRERLLAAARGEFARAAYEDASINRIIRQAGIPRGSFYMYFTDKEELFRYLLHLWVGVGLEQVVEYVAHAVERASRVFQRLYGVCKCRSLRVGSYRVYLGTALGHGLLECRHVVFRPYPVELRGSVGERRFGKQGILHFFHSVYA